MHPFRAAALAFLLAASAAAAASPCAAPRATDDGWPVAPADAPAGFDRAALCAVMERFATHPANLHGLVVERQGRLVAEAYREGPDRLLYGLVPGTVRFDRDELHDMRSVTKSVVALLWGIALGRGQVPAPATPVFDVLPELADLRQGGRGQITVDHLLSNRSGLAWREAGGTYGSASNDETPLARRRDLPRYVFDRPLTATPGVVFNYNGGHTAVLGELLVRGTGMSLPEFAQQHLFAPLGITQWEWRRDYRLRPRAYSGLRLRPRDAAKIGRMVLDGGRWQGRQVVPADWVRSMLQARASTGGALGGGYGYQWWTGAILAGGRVHEVQAAMGNGGQRIFLVPGLDLVVTLTGGEYNNTRIGGELVRLLTAIAGAVREGS